MNKAALIVWRKRLVKKYIDKKNTSKPGESVLADPTGFNLKYHPHYGSLKGPF